jgi:hypothetical protein
MDITPGFDRLFMLVAIVPAVVLFTVAFGAVFIVFHLFKSSDARRNEVRNGFEVKLTSGQLPEMQRKDNDHGRKRLRSY